MDPNSPTEHMVELLSVCILAVRVGKGETTLLCGDSRCDVALYENTSPSCLCLYSANYCSLRRISNNLAAHAHSICLYRIQALRRTPNMGHIYLLYIPLLYDGDVFVRHFTASSSNARLLQAPSKRNNSTI